jgi:hypothetical protein
MPSTTTCPLQSTWVTWSVGLVLACAASSIAAQGAPVASWSFNDGIGATLRDSSGTGTGRFSAPTGSLANTLMP